MVQVPEHKRRKKDGKRKVVTIKPHVRRHIFKSRLILGCEECGALFPFAPKLPDSDLTGFMVPGRKAPHARIVVLCYDCYSDFKGHSTRGKRRIAKRAAINWGKKARVYVQKKGIC